MNLTEGHPFAMLLELTHKVSIRLRRGKIAIHMDRKSLINDVKSEVKKASEFAKDCGAIRCQFKETKEKLDATMIVKCSAKKQNLWKSLKTTGEDI